MKKIFHKARQIIVKVHGTKIRKRYLLVPVVLLILALAAIIMVNQNRNIRRNEDQNHLEKARQAAANDNYAEAEKEFKLALSESNDKSIYRELGYVYLMEKKKTEAIDALENSLDNSEADAAALNNLGNLYRDNREYAKAEKDYLEAISANPGYTTAIINLSHLYTLTGKQDKAIELLENRFDGTKSSSLIGMQLASLYKSVDQSSKAAGILDEVIKSDPSNTKAQELKKAL